MYNYNHYSWTKEYSLPISALQHYAYCPRQFALIHIEEIYEENIFTLEGNFVHEKVDGKEHRSRNNCENSVPVWSDEFGIYGVIDVLEYKDNIMYPVEYKRGKKKKKLADEVQLCAQVLCLEELHNVSIKTAYIYYYSSRSRKKVKINQEIREKTNKIIKNARTLIKKRITPTPNYSSKCDNCSLNELCLPKANKKIKKYFKNIAGGE